MAADTRRKVPLLLLKTKSTPADGYEEYFSAFDNGRFDPVFVPVLEHRFKQDTLDQLRNGILGGRFLPSTEPDHDKYGAAIFTSQRAVEAFTQVVADIRAEVPHQLDELLPQSLPLYVVGPATARGLRALELQCPILGEESGNGDVLSTFILEHYNSLHPGRANPPILFLVGDKRRDIIPNALQSADLPIDRRSRVDEVVVYETGEMMSFSSHFTALWQKYVENGSSLQWVVVFSPTGCKAMLQSLGLLDENTGRTKSTAPRNGILVATIGPTTRDYLVKEFGFSPDVCAEKPSPEGIASGIQAFDKAGS
jgi:uroporphyrinogen-III synthase